MRIPIIAVVGRPNVGKSTLFNALVGHRRAIVEDVPGVTRDRNYAYVERYDFPISLVDTGGFDSTQYGVIEKQVREQTLLAIEEADVVLVLFDGKTGVQPGDDEVVELIRKSEKPVIYCVNKCDGVEQRDRTYEFYSLGVEELFDVSALNLRNHKLILEKAMSLLPDYEELKSAEHERRHLRSGEDTLPEEHEPEETEETEEWFEEPIDKDQIREEMRENREIKFAPVFVPGEGNQTADEYEKEYRLAEVISLPQQAEDDDTVWEAEETEEEELQGPETIDLVKVAIIGRPNVGKSTMLNALVGETRAITSPEAGTTRDSLDVSFEWEDQKYLLTDTAGMRKKGRITDDIEKYSTMRSLRAISDADVALLLIDAVEGPTEQDVKIAGVVHEQGKGLILVVNKWDLAEKDHRTAHEFKGRVKEAFKFAPYAPIIYTSALSGRRVVKVLPTAKEVALNRLRRIQTGRLNRFLQRQLRKVSPPSYRGVPIKVYYANQVDVCPPRFTLFVNQPKGVHFSYLRFIKNAIREKFAFEGTDLKLMLRKQ